MAVVVGVAVFGDDVEDVVSWHSGDLGDEVEVLAGDQVLEHGDLELGGDGDDGHDAVLSVLVSCWWT